MEFVYHLQIPGCTESKIDAPPVSIFQREVLNVVESGEPVLVACPYLNLDVFRELVGKCGGTWRLLTDVEELLRNQRRLEDRKRWRKELDEHASQVRDVAHLHAKVIVCGGKAFFGSANFTKSGMCSRTELSAVVHDEAEVRELREWFDAVWMAGVHPTSDELDLVLARFPTESTILHDPPRLLNRPTLVKSVWTPQNEESLAGATSNRAVRTRWPEDEFMSHADTKPQYELHKELIRKLKDLGFVRFRGTGKEPTYHVVVPPVRELVLAVYAGGRVYVQWGKGLKKIFGDRLVREYQQMWNGMLDLVQPNDEGAELSARLSPELCDLIVRNMQRLARAMK